MTRVLNDLQIAASRMEPNHFLMWVLLRFELFDYFNGGFSSQDQVMIFDFLFKNDVLWLAAVIELTLTLQDELCQWNRVIEEMLFLLIVIIGTVREKSLYLC